MEENTTTTVAAEAAIESIKNLMAAIGNDDELKQKLEDTLATLTGKVSAPQPETNEGQEPEPESEPAADDDANAVPPENNDAGKETAAPAFTRTTVSSDVISEDAIAGMVVGFVAGAALVGGGVILHKILSD